MGLSQSPGHGLLYFSLGISQEHTTSSSVLRGTLSAWDLKAHDRVASGTSVRGSGMALPGCLVR